jgi:hypothetical protein
MARKRKARGKELKAKVSLAALSGGSPSRIASRFGVHPPKSFAERPMNTNTRVSS